MTETYNMRENQFENRNKKKKRFYSILKKLYGPLDEYCSQSTLHGLKYIRDSTLPITDRVFWLVMFLLSLIWGSIVMVKVLKVYMENPFVIIHESHVTPVWEIPFPSVMICSYFMVKKSYVDLLQSTDRKMDAFSKLLCSYPVNKEILPSKVEYFNREENYTKEDFLNFVSLATPTCKEMFKSCYFQRKHMDCCEVFQPVLTQLGHCYIFNSIPRHVIFKNIVESKRNFTEPNNTIYWDSEKGYPKHHIERNDKINILPLWSEFSGEDLGLIVELIQNISELQFPCSRGNTGFQAVLASPANSPNLSPANIRIPTNVEMSLAIKPLTIRTDINLLDIPPMSRGCYYNHERNLNFFHILSLTNCFEESYGQMVTKKCGCIPYYIPWNSSLRMCFGSDSICESSVWEQMMKIKSAKSKLHHQYICLQSCSELMYKTNHYYSPIISWTDSDIKQKKQNLTISRLQVFYYARQFNGLHRQLEGSVYDLFGTCGGLLGLFLGFSLISAFELIYFFVICPICKLIDKKSHSLNKISPFSHRQFEINHRLNRFGRHDFK